MTPMTHSEEVTQPCRVLSHRSRWPCFISLGFSLLFQGSGLLRCQWMEGEVQFAQSQGCFFFSRAKLGLLILHRGHMENWNILIILNILRKRIFSYFNRMWKWQVLLSNGNTHFQQDGVVQAVWDRFPHGDVVDVGVNRFSSLCVNWIDSSTPSDPLQDKPCWKWMDGWSFETNL